MTTAAQFMAQLKEDNVLGAIDTIKRALSERAREVIVHTQANIAESYNMKRIAEESDEDEKEDDDEKDEGKDDDEEQLDKNKKTSKEISDEDEKEQ